MWKTNTIILIVIIAAAIVGIGQYEKYSTLKSFEQQIENSIQEEVTKQEKIIEEKFIKQFDSLIYKNKKLQSEIDRLNERVEFIKYGGESAMIRNRIKENATIKDSKKIKLRKREVYKHKLSNLLILIKGDYFEDRVNVNITMPNQDTKREDWELGKYNYYWNYQDRELSEIILTYLDDEKIELEWNYFKSQEIE